MIVHFAAMIDEESCPICLEELGHENRVTLESCKHVYCRSCVAILVFSDEYITCPMDRSNVSLINDSYLMEKSGLSKIEMATDIYRDILKMYDKTIIRNIIVENLSSSFLRAHKRLTTIEKLLRKDRKTMLKWLRRNQRIEVQDIENLEINDFDFDKDRLVSSSLYDLLIDSGVNDIETLYYQLFKWKSINDSISVKFDRMLDQFQYLSIADGEQMALLAVMVKRTESNVIHIRQIQRWIISMAIAVRGDDRALFREIQGKVSEHEKDKCLICAESINTDKYAMFAECHHKLCLKCVERFYICHGECPFFCDQSADPKSIIAPFSYEDDLDWLICQSENVQFAIVMKPILMNDGVETAYNHLMKNIDDITRDRSTEKINLNMNLINQISSSLVGMEIIAKEFDNRPSEMDAWQAVEITLKTSKENLKTYFQSLKDIKSQPYFQMAHETIKHDCLALFLCDTNETNESWNELMENHTLVFGLSHEMRYYDSILYDMEMFDTRLYHHYFGDVVLDENEIIYYTIIGLKNLIRMLKRFEFDFMYAEICEKEFFSSEFLESYNSSKSALDGYLKSRYSRIRTTFHANVLNDLHNTTDINSKPWSDWMQSNSWMFSDESDSSDDDFEMYDDESVGL